MAKKQKKTVVINTKAWGRGNYISDCGKCCALGFAYKQLVEPELQKDEESAIVMDFGDNKTLQKLDRVSLGFKDCKQTNEKKYIGKRIVDINDDVDDSKLRRNLLKKLFKKAGLRLLFK